MWRRMRELRQRHEEREAGGQGSGTDQKVSEVVHALKPSLTSIDMAARLLVMEGLSSEQRGEMCERILGQCQKMKALLDGFGGRQSAS